ncbi:MAG TPA: homoserine dehydrogenase [Flavisolibacter sp.]|nr:homoserine dehydrogenase [Flavisolibacter sp.]
MSKSLTIGLFGFGVVGEGIYQVLQQTPSLQAQIKRVCIKHAEKKRNAPAELFTTAYEAILNDEEINVIVELIDDADEAYKIVTAALRKGKAVVSANKKMIAEHLTELLALQSQYNASLLYEAAVGGSVPIIRNLEEYYDNDLLQSIYGIINGSTNYILSRIDADALSYNEALLQAQQLGFAESNPYLDVSGRDAVNKLSILLTHAYGVIVKPDQLLYRGIDHLHTADIAYAREKGYKVKLVAQAVKVGASKIAAFVLPQFVTNENQLYLVNNEYNGITLESRLADRQFLYGKGAGRFPTSSAVISDLSALRYHYKYEYKKRNTATGYSLTTDYYLKVYVSFDSWADINKWDFESIEALYSTEQRQHLIGLIHADKLAEADWKDKPDVSVIACPEPIILKDTLLKRSLKKISLQLAGVS